MVRLRFLTGVLCVCLLELLTVEIRAGVLPDPQGVFYYQPAASVVGGEALWINPSGLGRSAATGTQLMADYFDGKFIKSWGLLTQGDRFAFALRRLDNPIGTDFTETAWGAGFALGSNLQLGMSYRYFPKGPDYFNKSHTWNFGLQSSQGGPWRFGFVASNLNRQRINGERSEVGLRYSVAYRPLNDRLTLAADIFSSTHTKWRDNAIVYHAEYSPRAGLYVNGYIDSHKNFQFGVRANLLKYFVGSKSTFNRSGDGRGTTVFIGQTSMRQPSILKEPGRRLVASLPGNISENPPQPIFGRRSIPFTTLLAGLDRAASDRSIEEVVVDVSGDALGFGQAQEFRDAIVQLKRHHKSVTCFLESQTNKAYYIASAADRIIIPPVCQLNLVGLRSELVFYGGTLDKLGVKIEMLRIGAYKSATEAYTSTGSTPEFRGEVNRILDDIYDQFVAAIADGRRISTDSVKVLIDRGPFTSQEALDYGLVDALIYRDELFEKGLPKRPSISFGAYLADTLVNDSWTPRPVLAVVVADGEIAGGGPNTPGSSEGLTPPPFKRAFDLVRSDPRVRGILFRVNSPGGYALAADEIFHSATRAAERKPIVVSMASVAASGGYQLSMAGRHVFALPATITGSIGIFGGKADFSGLYQKINLNKELYTRGRFAGMLTNMRPFSPEEREKYFSQLSAYYNYFVDIVANNRKLTRDSVNDLGEGRVWSGREARQNGLVDELGGYQESIEYTARLAGVKDYDVTIYPQKRPLFIFPGLHLFRNLTRVFARDKNPVESLRDVAIPPDGIYSRMPFDLNLE